MPYTIVKFANHDRIQETLDSFNGQITIFKLYPGASSIEPVVAVFISPVLLGAGDFPQAIMTASFENRGNLKVVCSKLSERGISSFPFAEILTDLRDEDLDQYGINTF